MNIYNFNKASKTLTSISFSGTSPLMATASFTPSATAIATACSMIVLWMNVMKPPETRIGVAARTTVVSASLLKKTSKLDRASNAKRLDVLR